MGLVWEGGEGKANCKTDLFIGLLVYNLLFAFREFLALIFRVSALFGVLSKFMVRILLRTVQRVNFQ